MSHSELYVMDKDSNGESLYDFSNSWLFSPVVWDILYHKYIPGTPADRNYMSASMFDGGETWRMLNSEINDSSEQVDRIAWELSQQQTFFTKDKEFVASCIEKFFDVNERYTTDIKNDSIFDRAKEIAESIRSLDESTQPYFAFKNTSCDDGVERWFIGDYSEEDGEYARIGLRDQTVHCTEFVYIEDDKIKEFVSNLVYFEEEKGNEK